MKKLQVCGLLALLMWVVNTGVALAAPQHFESGEQQTMLVELFTSEGCSSCPPAEAFMNTLIQDEQLWRRVIPLALHVGYWDYLGWKDAFADPAHAQRQRAYAKAQRASTVYTPAWFINGRSWRPSLFYRQLPEVEAPRVGKLSLLLEGSGLHATFKAADLSSPRTLYVARLGFGLESQIRAGENRGRHARHDFVVIGYTAQSSATGEWRLPLPEPRIVGVTTQALVAWVSRGDSPVPLQSVGGWLK